MHEPPETVKRPAVLPIWVSALEFDCCMEDLSVGDEWESTLLSYEGLTSTGAEPVGWTPGDDGFIAISGQVLRPAANEDAMALVDVGQFRVGAQGVMTSGNVGGRTRLHFEGHVPFFSIEPAEVLVSGVLQRIQRYPIVWRHVEDVFYERAGYRRPVDISSTAERTQTTTCSYISFSPRVESIAGTRMTPSAGDHGPEVMGFGVLPGHWRRWERLGSNRLPRAARPRLVTIRGGSTRRRPVDGCPRRAPGRGCSTSGTGPARHDPL